MGETVKAKVVGRVTCSDCGQETNVRMNKSSKLFYECECGLIYPNSPAGQARLEAKMRPLPDEAGKSLDPKKGGADVAGGVAKSSPGASEEVKTAATPPEKPKTKFEGFL